MKKLHLLTALAICPLIPSLLILVILSLTSEMNGYIELAILIATGLAYILILVVGIPLYIFLESKRIQNFSSYLIAGLVAGITVPVLCVTYYMLDNDSWAGILFFATIGAIYGSVMASTFWLIVKKDNYIGK